MRTDTLIYLEYIRKVVFTLPGTREAPCYGTEGFYVQKKLLTRMKEDGETLVVPVNDRDKLMKNDPGTFYITDHYINSNYVLIKLPNVEPDILKGLLIDAWLKRAPKTLLKEYLANEK